MVIRSSYESLRINRGKCGAGQGTCGAYHMAHILILGLGDLGTGLAQALMRDGHRVSAIRRRNEAPPGVDLYAQDILEGTPLLPPDQVDLLYIILTPDGRDEAAYQRVFLGAPARLLDALAGQQPLPPVIFVSSTAVYGEAEGTVDELTPPRPARFNGRILLAAEEEISLRTVGTSVRFSGIYGPGRLRLLRQVDAIAGGEAPPAPVLTNRIHSADCVGLLRHLGERWLKNDAPPAVVIGTDQCPVSNLEVLGWLGERTGHPLGLVVPEQVPGRAVHSEYLGGGQYRLLHPDYRSGYQAVLQTLQ